MSNQVAEFFSHLKGNEALIAEVSAAEPAGMIAIAAREGYSFSQAEIDAIAAENADSAAAELSDAELEQVSGGTIIPTMRNFFSCGRWPTFCLRC